MLSNEKVDINIVKKSETKIYDEKDAYVAATDSEIQETIETEFKTALYYAVENEKLELLNLLLSNESIDVNLACKSDEYYRLAYYNENRMENKYEVEKNSFILKSNGSRIFFNNNCNFIFDFISKREISDSIKSNFYPLCFFINKSFE